MTTRKKNDDNFYTEETVAALPAVFIWAVVLFVIGAAMTTGALALKPAWMGFEREIVQQSPQYVESKRTLLNGLLQDWNQLEVEIVTASTDVAAAKRGQQIAILNRMHDEAGRLPSTEVPPAVTAFLSTENDR